MRLTHILSLALMGVATLSAMGQNTRLSLELTYQEEVVTGTQRYHRVHRPAEWPAAQTAIIVCDVWDSHHSINAVRRVEEFAPRLNEVLTKAREAGVLIIHAPSDCMPAYQDHPSRQRAQQLKSAEPLPESIASWCSKIPAEEQAVYPIDQTDGGEDDDPEEHRQWAERLAREGRNPGTPWLRQHPALEIDPQRDYLSDRGDEVWNILAHHQIDHVILAGVHTNMCVLGRPFGLRQMVRTGKQVALLRDLTDTMYNPARWPFVSHFTGTDLIIDHVERFVCPTMTSDQFLGGQAFRFKDDHRPHVVIVMGESLYQTDSTLPRFALANLGKSCRVSFVFAEAEDKNQFPGSEVIQSADLVLVSVRRRTPPAEQLAFLREHVARGKPMLGIRTASHAFSVRDETVAVPLDHWPDFDPQVWGGNYHGHYPDTVPSTVEPAPNAARHPWLTGVPQAPLAQSGSLYQTAPLAPGAQPLLMGKVEGQPAEPVAWTFKRADGGVSFYTSLGHPGDFENPAFVRLLSNAVHGLLGLDLPGTTQTATELADRRLWKPLTLSHEPTDPPFADSPQPAWYRCAFRLPPRLSSTQGLTLQIDGVEGAKAWLNGQPLADGDRDQSSEFQLTPEQLGAEETHLLVIRVPANQPLAVAPRVTLGSEQYWFNGQWEYQVGESESLSGLPLPAKFGVGTDIYLEPQAK